jgi:hypothetical protein
MPNEFLVVFLPRKREEEGEIHSEITTGNYRNFSRHASA